MFKRIPILASAAVLSVGLMAGAPAGADEPATYTLTIKDHKFTPDKLEVPAGKEFVLLVKNEDPTPEEFESHDLHREKVIGGGKSAKINIKALKAGEYSFIGEFHETTAKGVIVAK